MAVPSDYAGLEFHYQYNTGYWQDSARTTPATAGGDPIGAWDDQSGNARHATQVTNARRPTLGTTSLIVQCQHASQQWLALPNFLTGFTVGEIFALVRAEADPAAVQAGFWRFGSTNDIDAHPWTDGISYQGFGATVRKTVGNVAPNLSTYHVLHILSKAGLWQMWIDGVSVFSTATNTVGWATNPCIGKSINAGVTDFFGNHRFVEVFMYSQERSGAERSALLSYLQGVFASVPNKHIITQEGMEVVGDFVPKHRITQEGIDLVFDPHPPHRITQAGSDIVWDPHPPHRITLMGVEIVTDNIRGSSGYAYLF